MNKKYPSITINFLMNIILTMSSFIFPLITFPYISRVLGADGNGKIQLAASFVSYFTLVSQLGIPTYGIKLCSTLRDDRNALSVAVQELLIINIIMTIASYTAFFAILSQVPRLHAEKTLYIVSSAAIILNTLGMEWLFKAIEQYSYITIRSLAFKVISIIAMFLLVHQESDYLLYAGISVFAASGSSLVNLTQVCKYVDLKPVAKYNLQRHLKPILILFAYTCATTIYCSLDSVMLGFMTTDAEVGYYAVAVKLKNILVCVVTALGAVLLPRVSYFYKQGQMDAFWQTISKSMRVVILMAAPLTVYCMLAAGPAIRFLAGDGYTQAVTPMILIMPTLLFIGMTYVTGVEVLIPMGKESVVLLASVIAAVVDIAINALLIPSMKSSGAAIGTLIAEAIVFAIQYYVLRQHMTPIFKELKLLTPFLAVSFASISSLWIFNLPLSDFWLLFISVVVFFGVYAIVLLIKREPMLIELLHRGTQLLKKLIP